MKYKDYMKKRTRPSPPSNSDSQRRKILSCVLQQVPFDGWTEAAFANGIKQTGLTRAEATRLMPGGIRDAIEQFGLEADDAMEQAIKANRGFARLRTRDKVAFGVRTRLEYLTPQREAVRRLMFWYALPLNMPMGLRRMMKTVDLIWKAAGDTATDYNFYTKRILLAGVMKATILYWLDDASANCEASWAFLDRRISEILKVGKSISLLKEFSPDEVMGFIKRKIRSG